MTTTQPQGPPAPAHRRQAAVTEYLSSVSQIVSSLRSAEITLSIIDADADDWREEQARASASRVESLEAVRVDAEAEREFAAKLRATHGLPNRAGDDQRPGRTTLGGMVPGDAMDPALSSLKRQHDELEWAEASYRKWQQGRDDLSRKLVVAAAGAVGLVTVALMVVLSPAPVLSMTTIGLLGVSTVVVVAAALGVAVARSLPDVAVAHGTTSRRTLAIARFGGRLAGPAAAALTVTRLFAEILS